MSLMIIIMDDDIDLSVRQVKAARSRGKVYSMAFVGINGVGKSTSLAKVAYYLKENGIKVPTLLCASILMVVLLVSLVSALETERWYRATKHASAGVRPTLELTVTKTFALKLRPYFGVFPAGAVVDVYVFGAFHLGHLLSPENNSVLEKQEPAASIDYVYLMTKVSRRNLSRDTSFGVTSSVAFGKIEFEIFITGGRCYTTSSNV